MKRTGFEPAPEDCGSDLYPKHSALDHSAISPTNRNPVNLSYYTHVLHQLLISPSLPAPFLLQLSLALRRLADTDVLYHILV